MGTDRKELAVFTITQNDGPYLQHWLWHYQTRLPETDLYILDHGSRGDSAACLREASINPYVHVLPVAHQWSFDGGWLPNLATHFQRFLLDSYYSVVFIGADELLTLAPPAAKPADLHDYLVSAQRSIARCAGYEVVHKEGEAPLQFCQPVLAQRSVWYSARRYSKPVVSGKPIFWQPGFYSASNLLPETPELQKLWLIHLHRADFQACLARHRERIARPWLNEWRIHRAYQHNLIDDPGMLRRWFNSDADDMSVYAKLVEIPAEAKNLA